MRTLKIWMGEGRSRRYLQETWRYSLMQGFPAVRHWHPPTDIYETEEAFFIRLEVPGVDLDSVSVEVQEDQVVIRGERPNLCPEGVVLHQIEILSGPFQVAVLLPKAVDAGRARAAYEAGFLTVELPKVPPQRVPIETASQEE